MRSHKPLVYVHTCTFICILVVDACARLSKRAPAFACIHTCMCACACHASESVCPSVCPSPSPLHSLMCLSPFLYPTPWCLAPHCGQKKRNGTMSTQVVQGHNLPNTARDYAIPAKQGDNMLNSPAMCFQVLEKRNVRRAARLRELYRDRRRSCVLFDNSHFLPTATSLAEQCALLHGGWLCYTVVHVFITYGSHL
jgi:hypothetical protein